MKNRRFYLLSVLVILFITVCSCGDDREKLPYTSNSITFPSSENTRPTFSSQGGTVSLSFTAAEDWAANLTNTRGDNWITVNPTSGSKGEAQITITTTANETFDNRSAKVVLKCGTNADTLFISQLAKGAIIVAEKEYQFSKEGGELNLKVQSNLELEVTTSEPWIEQIQPTTRNLTEYELKFNIWPISVEHDQQGTITIKDKASDQQQIIVIKQIFVDSLTREALIALYKATDGDHWINNTNWCSDAPYKEWYGVKTSILGIINISLSKNGLSGTLPEEIGNIKDLAQLDLSYNKISGKIPNSIGETKLMALYLNKNNLSGEIPEGIGKLKNLMYLSLSLNKLSGSIPKWIGNLTKLEYLRLSNNRLTGTIPVEIGNLKSLETFDIANYTHDAYGEEIIFDKLRNQISGPIPVEVCQLPKLRYFYVNDNRLSGKIPEEIWSLPSLISVGLSGNKFSGMISPNIRNAKQLKQLFLENNLLTGTLIEELFELTNLEELTLGNATSYSDGSPIQEYNQFEGSISESIGKLTKLRQFEVSNAGLTGEIPQSLYQLTAMDTLNLGNASVGIAKVRNSFSGKLSPEIKNLKDLDYFAIGGNNLEGTIPEELGDLPLTHALILYDNRFQGAVPRKLLQSPYWRRWNPEELILPQQNGYRLSIDYK